MSPIEFLTASIEFGGIKRNYEENGKVFYADIVPMIEMIEKLLDSHQKQVHQELRLLKEISELRKELGKGDRF